MRFQQILKVAGAGTNRLTLNLPTGATLKKINALNATKPWQKCSLGLAEVPAGTGRGLSLLHMIPQPGDRDLSWEGEISVDAPFLYIVATFYGCDASDALTLTVGYEMPPARPRRWW